MTTVPLAVQDVRAGRPVQVDTFAAWREAARDLLAYDIAPDRITWSAPHMDDLLAGDLFTSAPPPVQAALALPADASKAQATAEPTRPPPHIPRSFMEMLQSAACCRVPDRWAFLYRVIWRWQQGEHDVQSPADEDGARLNGMVKTVRREEHDMHAYIRFRERPVEAGPPRFVAWYEPRHDVLPQVAQHFVSRMGKVTWMIATPEASVLWDGHTLHNTGPLVKSADDLEDSGEALWLTYYRSIFNPARLNTEVMRQHIQGDRWKNLPEGKIVTQMVSDAAMGARRTGQLQAVGQRRGTTIPIAPADAQPDRQQPSKLDECRRCSLWESATQAVPGIGPAQARIMFVGEQPGDQEDLAGQPFIGPAGQLLDRVCAAAGVDRDIDLRDQRRQAFQVGAARQAAPAQDAGAAGNRGVPLLARQGIGERAADRHRGARRDGAQVRAAHRQRDLEEFDRHAAAARGTLGRHDVSPVVRAARAERRRQARGVQCDGRGLEIGAVLAGSAGRRLTSAACMVRTGCAPYDADMPICRYVDMSICRYVDMPMCRYVDMPICRYADDADTAMPRRVRSPSAPPIRHQHICMSKM